MKIDIQRLRNLTTGRLHTDIYHIHKDLEAITGEEGLMTHMLPNALKAVTPWLKSSVKDQRFFNNEYDPNHIGEIEIPDPTEKDREEMFEIYKSLLS